MPRDSSPFSSVIVSNEGIKVSTVRTGENKVECPDGRVGGRGEGWCLHYMFGRGAHCIAEKIADFVKCLQC